MSDPITLVVEDYGESYEYVHKHTSTDDDAVLDSIELDRTPLTPQGRGGFGVLTVTARIVGSIEDCLWAVASSVDTTVSMNGTTYQGELVPEPDWCTEVLHGVGEPAVDTKRRLRKVVLHGQVDEIHG